MNLKPITLAVIALILSMGSCQNVKTTMEKKETAVIDAIMSRRSIRQYKDTPVPRDLSKIKFVEKF